MPTTADAKANFFNGLLFIAIVAWSLISTLLYVVGVLTIPGYWLWLPIAVYLVGFILLSIHVRILRRAVRIELMLTVNALSILMINQHNETLAALKKRALN